MSGADHPDRLHPPFLRAGPRGRDMVLWTVGAMTVLAILYAVSYNPAFILRFAAVIAAGLGLEVLYSGFSRGRFVLRSGSSAVTAAALVLSIPPNMPPLPLFLALVFALVIVRFPAGERELRWNGALVGRLFLMLAFNAQIVDWPPMGAKVDGLTTATPLDLFHTERAVYAVSSLAVGRVSGTWGDLYQLVPGGPGEMFGPVILLLGAILYLRGVSDWRTGVSFLLSFLVACAVINLPVARELAAAGAPGGPVWMELGRVLTLNLFGGALLFSAVFIASDPMTTPVTRGGRWMAGGLAGVANALIRGYTYYPEGIVYSFLLVNLAGPSLDRLCFHLRGRRLAQRRRAAGP